MSSIKASGKVIPIHGSAEKREVGKRKGGGSEGNWKASADNQIVTPIRKETPLRYPAGRNHGRSVVADVQLEGEGPGLDPCPKLISNSNSNSTPTVGIESNLESDSFSILLPKPLVSIRSVMVDKTRLIFLREWKEGPTTFGRKRVMMFVWRDGKVLTQGDKHVSWEKHASGIIGME